MSGSNHIVGGTVFTGIYLSMWNINIFSAPYLLFFTAFFSVLPDIDHTRSPIGKVFYPIAKYIDKKFGHRTITHSLIFYTAGIFIVATIEKLFFPDSYLTKIFIWAFGSHLIFDMLTKQGVPLFYPFKKNPCVIPGNPDYRFRSGSFKTEATLFVVFIALGFMCANLFKHGFWNTYNRNFTNIKHVSSEMNLSDKIIKVNYKFQRVGNLKKGEGYAIKSTGNSLVIFDRGFIIVNSEDKIIELVPIRTNKNIQERNISFADITIDSLNKITKDIPILNIKLQSKLPIQYTKDNTPHAGTAIDLDNQFNPVFTSQNIDSTDLSIQKDIELLKMEISIAAQEQKINANQRSILTAKYKRLEKELMDEDLAVREQATKEFPSIKQQFENLKEPIDKSQALQLRLKFLQSKSQIKKDQSITGYISYFIIN